MKKLTVLGVLTLSLSHCGMVSSPSHLKHDAGQPVRPQSKPWLWANDTEAEYLAMGNSSDSTSLLGPKKFLPSDHPMTKRLQAWITELDTHIRAEHPTEMAQVPSPIVHVEVTSDINAFVTAIPVCYDNVKLTFDGSQNSGSRDGSQNVAIINDGAFMGGASAVGQSPTEMPDCRHTKLTLAELNERLDFLNGTHKDCKVTLKPGVDLSGSAFEVLASKNCLLTGDLENTSGAAVLGMLATSRHVTVFTGILGIMSEEAIIAVLAHELGHYYRPHIGSGNVHYNFAYDASGVNPNKRPDPKAGNEDIAFQVDAVNSSYMVSGSRLSNLQHNVPKEALHAVSGSEFHPTMLPVLKELMILYSSTSNVACVEAFPMGESLETNHVLQSLFLPLRDLTDAESAKVTAWEAKAMACLESIKLDAANASPNAAEAMESATSNWAFARKAAKPVPASGTLLDWVRKIDAGVKSAYQAADILPATEFSDEAIKAINAKTDSEVAASKDLALKFEQGKLGFYTPEQEADELSAEWVNGLHIDVKAPGDAFMSFIKLFESDDVYNACNAKRQNKWLEADQSSTFVPWNTLMLDPHPDSCYRVRDVDLEMNAHSYSNPAEGPRQMPNSPKWDDLVAALPKPHQPLATSIATSARGRVSHWIGTAKGPFSRMRPLHCAFDAQH
jgi:hypothetical protein